MTTALRQCVESLVADGSAPCRDDAVDDLRNILELLSAPVSDALSPKDSGTPLGDCVTKTGPPPASLRQRLGGNVDDLKHRLCELMAERVCIDDLLPMTFDEQANDDAMSEQQALTLTETSMLAAQVYLKLLADPSAFSAGLVDLHALSEFPRLIARWRTECTGREDALVVNGNQRPKAGSKLNQATKRTRRSADLDYNSPSEEADEPDADSEDDGGSMGAVFEEIHNENILTPRRLIVRGLELASLLSELPLQKMFVTWNGECAASIIESICSCLATMAALFKCKVRGSQNIDPTLEERGTKIIERMSLALKNCASDHAALTVGAVLDMTIAVQRNLYLWIVLDGGELPNGNNGKLIAARIAAEVFQKFAFGVTAYIEGIEKVARSDGSRPSDFHQTPVTKRRLSLQQTSENKNRHSLTGLQRPQGGSPTPVKLKSRNSIDQLEYTTTRRRSESVSLQNASLHPVLQKIVSMIQKLLTDPRNSATEVRESTCTTVEQYLLSSHHAATIHFVLCWVVKMSNSNVDAHRLTAIRLAGFALANSSLCGGLSSLTHWEDENDDPDGGDISLLLFDMLQKRLHDLKQPVRVAAATEFVAFFDGIKNDGNKNSLLLLQTQAENMIEIFRSLVLDESSATGKISFVKGLVSLLGIVKELKISVCSDDFETLIVTCQETKSVMLRAATAEGLTNLLEYSCGQDNHSLMMNQWSLAILPLVLDPELKVHTKALQVVDKIVLDPLVNGKDVWSQTHRDQAWIILSAISLRSVQPGSSKMESDALRAAVARRADIWELFASLNRFGDRVVDGLHNTELSNGFFFLLDAILDHNDDIYKMAQSIKRVTKDKRDSFDFVFRCFMSLFDSDKLTAAKQAAARVYCLEVLAKLAICIDSDFSGVRGHLRSMLSSFRLDSFYITSALRLYILSIIATEDKEAVTSACVRDVKLMLDRCEQEIVSRAGDEKLSAGDEAVLSRAFRTIGELRMAGFLPDDNCGKKDVLSVISSYEIDVYPSDSLRSTVLTFAHACNFAESQGHALIALGKLCLRDERFAKDCISVFIEALQNETNALIRSNALLCMGDLIVRYTNLADRFLPEMAACLQAGSSSGNKAMHARTRKHAILVLTDLLLQDYIKWRGHLFHRFLLAAIDEDEAVAAMAESMLCGPLKLQKSKLFASHFVESLFVFNECEAHDIPSSVRESGSGSSTVGFVGVELRGRNGQSARQRLYELMISQLKDDEKIAATAGIAKDILTRCLQQGSTLHRACIVDDEDDSTFNVLLDALTILSSKTIQPRRLTSDDEDSDGMSKNDALRLKVRGALLSKVSRKHLLEHMLPMLIQLRETLKRHQSPLVPLLMEYFITVFRLFPEELKDNLSVKQPILLQEIEHDAKKKTIE